MLFLPKNFGTFPRHICRHISRWKKKFSIAHLILSYEEKKTVKFFNTWNVIGSMLFLMLTKNFTKYRKHRNMHRAACHTFANVALTKILWFYFVCCIPYEVSHKLHIECCSIWFSLFLMYPKTQWWKTIDANTLFACVMGFKFFIFSYGKFLESHLSLASSNIKSYLQGICIEHVALLEFVFFSISSFYLH